MHAHSASIDHAWQALAFPWWQRWLFSHAAALSRRPPRKPAEAAARNLRRLLLLSGTQTPRGDVSRLSSDAAKGGLVVPAADEGGPWGSGLLSGGRQRKVWGGDTPSVRLRLLYNAPDPPSGR